MASEPPRKRWAVQHGQADERKEILRHVEAVCGAEVASSLDAHGVKPELLRKRAQQLLDFSKQLSSSRKAVAPQVPTTSRMEPSWPMFLCCLATIVGLTLPYYICITYNSWFVDEAFAIYRNPDARGETRVWDVLQHDFWGTALNPPEGYITHKSWRPLITLMYAAEWQVASRLGFGGAEMKPMRLLSCMVHSCNAGLVLLVLCALRLPLFWAGVGAALFAAHPIHIENIVYLVGRADSLSTLFYLLALLLYLRLVLPAGSANKGLPPLKGYLSLILLTATSGLCKEPGFTALFFLAAAEVALRCRWRHVFGLLAAFAALAGLRTWYVGGTDAGFGYVDTPIRYQDANLHGTEEKARIVRTLSYLFQHACYAKLLVLPWNQSWDYSYDSLPMVTCFHDLRMQGIVVAYLAVAAMACHSLRLRRTCPALILGLGLIIVPFIPASNLFFLVGTTVGERLLYPLTAGWALLVAGLGSRYAGSHHQVLRSARLLRITVVALLVVYIVNSNIRMTHWRSPDTLFLQDAKYWHRSVKVLHAKASELQATGDLPEALDYYQQSLNIFDDQAITDYCIARILINLGRFQEAYERFNKILTGHGIGLHDGNDFLWMTDLGYVLVKLGADSQGAHYLQEGLQRMPYSCYAWNALGVAQARQNQLEQAVQSLTQGLQCDPTSPLTWSNLAAVYAYGKAAQQASEALQEALRLNASHPVIAHNAQVLTGTLPGKDLVFDLFIPKPGRR